MNRHDDPSHNSITPQSFGDAKGAPPSDPVADQLVAYLDGEVNPEERLAIESRLADDADYREMFLDLQRSWRLLDRLPRADSNDSFTKTTIAMVASDLRATGVLGNDTPLAANGTRQLPRTTQQAGWAAALVAMAIIGFAIVYLPDRWRFERELRDLPVAKNLDLYHYADNIEFLRQLEASGTFSEESDDAY